MNNEPVIITCRCGHRMRVPEAYLDQSGPCPSCKTTIVPRQLMGASGQEQQQFTPAASAQSDAEAPGPSHAIEEGQVQYVPLILRCTAWGAGLSALCGALLIGIISAIVSGSMELLAILPPVLVGGMLCLFAGALVGTQYGLVKFAGTNLSISLTSGTTLGLLFGIFVWLIVQSTGVISGLSFFTYLLTGGIFGAIPTLILDRIFRRKDE